MAPTICATLMRKNLRFHAARGKQEVVLKFLVDNGTNSNTPKLINYM